MVDDNMKNMLFMVSMLFFLALPVFATSNITQYCSDFQTLTNVDSWVFCEDASCSNLQLESNTTCAFGCEKDKCVESPLNSILIVAVFFAVIFVALFFIRRGV